jgi:hypothetical protein
MANTTAKLGALTGINVKQEQRITEKILREFEVKKRYWPHWPEWK